MKIIYIFLNFLAERSPIIITSLRLDNGVKIFLSPSLRIPKQPKKFFCRQELGEGG